MSMRVKPLLPVPYFGYWKVAVFLGWHVPFPNPLVPSLVLHHARLLMV